MKLPSGSRVFVAKEHAKQFLYEAYHPDPEIQRKRDDFFTRLNREMKEHNFQRDSVGNMSIDIPDIN